MQPKDALKRVNTKKIIAPKAEKSCEKLKFCLEAKKRKVSCPLFGGDCCCNNF